MGQRVRSGKGAVLWWANGSKTTLFADPDIEFVQNLVDAWPDFITDERVRFYGYDGLLGAVHLQPSSVSLRKFLHEQQCYGINLLFRLFGGL